MYCAIEVDGHQRTVLIWEKKVLALDAPGAAAYSIRKFTVS